MAQAIIALRKLPEYWVYKYVPLKPTSGISPLCSMVLADFQLPWGQGYSGEGEAVEQVKHSRVIPAITSWGLASRASSRPARAIQLQ